MEPELGLLVVGGGPAGLSAARSYRATGGEGGVRIVSDDRHPPYERPPLSKDFLRGESYGDDLALEKSSFYAEQDIDLVLESPVLGLDVARREVALRGGERVGFRACVLATGSSPIRLPVPGGDHPDILLLRSRSHGEELRARAERAARAVVVGSGFIGCEAAVSLAQRGVRVTMVSMESRPQLARLGPDVADRIRSWLEAAGVRVLAGQRLRSVEDGRRVTTQDGTTVDADLVLVAAGIKPHGELAADARLPTRKGRIVVDERMRSSAGSVYAAGDVALARNAAAGGRHLAVEHWGEALRMGEVAGTNAAGGDDVWAQVPGFWSEIGHRTLKYAAWGDGWDEARLVDHGAGAFTAWYGADGVTVGVLAHDADEDYERGQQLVEGRAPLPHEDG